ncbi:NrdB ribonucleotide reductase beta subunit [Acinetobacter phage Ac42]|uniref:NrdB ribonucleotide reductase beta subunit n=1 Tax=Acinetobacter phage Ac42 TaxID=762660 RepID=UPI0001EBCE0B|nr:NrdB ribonucleotide reductase beta subunit [Acinetobacter phage Ac42]ADI96463.1 NrdB ribonucleotide reductase beta subunit [Acinetobacter phage Ac42]
MIFNVAKPAEEYYAVKLFGNNNDDGTVQLLDTINKRFDKIWDLYKEMKALDWDEQDFDFAQCLTDFKRVPKKVADTMIYNIMWQWETDSVASQVPFVLIAPYDPCSEIVAAELRINDNETVHGATYSEIVKLSFDMPKEVLKELLAKTEAHRRLHVVGTELAALKRRSVELAYHGSTHFSEEEKTIDMMLFYYLMYVLERVQFMISFGVTFTICESGVFQAIGSAVKKICQDEFEIHCEYRLEVLKELLASEHGQAAFAKLRPKMIKILKEVIESEITWAKFLFEDGQAIVGMNADVLIQWALFNAKAVAQNFGFTEEELGFVFPEENPMPHLESWININKTQNANQETVNGAYKVNVIKRNDQNTSYKFKV